jgi:ankyrin repeat protein
LAAGADIHWKDSFNTAALHLAARGGHMEALVTLLEAGADVDINLSDNSGRTAIHYAAENDHKDAVFLLLDKGADVRAKNHYSWRGASLLYLAASREEYEELLNITVWGHNAADMDAALQFAAFVGEVKASSLLIAMGANVNSVDKVGSYGMRCRLDSINRSVFVPSIL